LNQIVNTPIYRCQFYALFELFVKVNNILRFKNSFAFEMVFNAVGM
jgi:hypothetical protein